jgi:hypothetical protein
MTVALNLSNSVNIGMILTATEVAMAATVDKNKYWINING